MKHEQAELFDRLAEQDCLYAYPPASLRAVNEIVANKGKVLDVGCGDGTLSAALDGDLVVGFDISPRCVTLAACKGVKALVADAVRGLPFADHTFDTVYCVSVLHHLGQLWEPILSEFTRVLRPGGMLILAEPDARNPLVRWTQAPHSPIRVAPYDDEPAIYPEHLFPLLEERGYEHECQPFQFEAHQVVRDVFPLWQRLCKAPFVILLAWWYRQLPKMFVIRARKKMDG